MRHWLSQRHFASSLTTSYIYLEILIALTLSDYRGRADLSSEINLSFLVKYARKPLLRRRLFRSEDVHCTVTY